MGHTHEDIDQFFRTVSGRLNSRPILTPSSFLEEITSSNAKVTVHPSFFNDSYNFKSWFQDFSEMGGHSKPLHFCFMMTLEGMVFLHKYTSDSKWISAPCRMKTLPAGTPNAHPLIFTVLKDLSTRLDALARNLCMTEEQREQWVSWIQEQTNQKTPECPIQRLTKWRDRAKRNKVNLEGERLHEAATGKVPKVSKPLWVKTTANFS